CDRAASGCGGRPAGARSGPRGPPRPAATRPPPAPAAPPPRPAPPAPVARATAGPEAVGRPLALSFAVVPLREPDAAGRMSFQHALAAGSHAKVRYEVTVRQPREFALDAVVSFSPVADSAIVYRDGAEFTRYSWLDREGIPIPPARPGAEIRIVAWSSERGDSATLGVVVWPSEHRDAASVRRLAGRRELLVRAPVHNPIMPAVGTDWVPAFRGARPGPDSMGAPAPREHKIGRAHV